MARNKTNGDKHDCGVMARFTKAQLAVLEAAKPHDEELAVFVRRMALQGASTPGSNTTPDLRRAVAFVIGALSSEYSPDEVLPLFDEYMGGA